MKAIRNSEASTKTTTMIGNSDTIASPLSAPPERDRDLDALEDRLNDRFVGPRAELALRPQDQPMGERARRQLLDVVGQHVFAAPQPGQRLRRAEERKRAAGACAERHVRMFARG